jgi:tetratricopeptide (TPR) repeat protein
LVERGRWYVQELRWDDAHAAFTRAVQLRPDHGAAWAERSELYARLGLWDLAAADCARELEVREPDLTFRWYCHALLRLHTWDADGYRQVCRRMRERFRGYPNSLFAIESVRASVLAPACDADPTELLEVAQNAVASHPRADWFLYVVGIAHYRAGQYEQAVRRLRDSLRVNPAWLARAINYPILAMAHHRLGQKEEARQALDQAARVIDQWTGARYQSQRGHWVLHLGATGFWPAPWFDWLECQHYYREARVLIDGSPPAADPRLRVLRARAFAGLRWQTRADAQYREALKRLPDDPQVRLEAHRNRGYRRAGRRQWTQAAGEFARASALQPEEPYLWHFQAVAHLGAADLPAYRRVCAAMVDRFRKTRDARTAREVVFVCVLRDAALPDMDRLVRLARVAAPDRYGNTYVLGAALYRAGRYREAVQCFEAAAKVDRPRAWDWSFLAMAHHRLGHAGAARRCLAESAAWIEQANRRHEDDLSRTRPAWGGWYKQVVFPLLHREAEALVQGAKEDRSLTEGR